jgi:Protein of unknown function (DUF3396)
MKITLPKEVSNIEELQYVISTDLSDKSTLEPGKHIILTPGIKIELAFGPHFKELAPKLLRAYATFLKRYENRLNFIYEGTTAVKKMKPEKLELFPQWLEDPAQWNKDILTIDLYNGGKFEKLAPCFHFWSQMIYENRKKRIPLERKSSLTIFLPVDEEPQAIVDFLREMIGEDFPFASGLVSYTLFWNTQYHYMQRGAEGYDHYIECLKRFPGLSDGETFLFYEEVLQGIYGVNWLTLLGEQLTQRKGGKTAIAKTLGKDIKVHSLGKGVCIQAGDSPKLGDMKQGDDLPLYRKVGQFLKDLRIPVEFDLFPRHKDTDAWLARFDD